MLDRLRKQRVLPFVLLLSITPTTGFSRNATNDALYVTATVPSPTCPVIHACFTPFQNCTREIVEEILQAKHSILVQAYSFSSRPIAEALVQAKKKGVSVKVILDKTQRTQKYSLIHFIVDNEIPVWIDMKAAIAHNKIMIIDGEKVITGSFNFTASAQARNAENVLFVSGTQLAQSYTENWELRKSMSPPYERA